MHVSCNNTSRDFCSPRLWIYSTSTSYCNVRHCHYSESNRMIMILEISKEMNNYIFFQYTISSLFLILRCLDYCTILCSFFYHILISFWFRLLALQQNYQAFFLNLFIGCPLLLIPCPPPPPSLSNFSTPKPTQTRFQNSYLHLFHFFYFHSD